MYDNIGGRIKGLALVMFFVLSALAFIAGIALMAASRSLIGYGFFVIILVPLVALISSRLLYGFGELIDKICDIELNTRAEGRESGPPSKDDAERIRKIEDLLSKGLITEEEYQRSISK